MKLINVDSNFSVESFKFGNMTFEFVHNNKTMDNYFNQKVLAKLFDVHKVTVGEHLNNYLKSLENFQGNSLKVQIKLKTDESKQRVKFYGFDAVTYLAFRINTPEAINVRDFVSHTLNTMFNVATGKTDMDTKLDKLKNMLEVEELKSDKYLQVYKELIKFDEELANETYHKYKVSKNNTFNCHELLMAKRDWDKRYNEVRDTIEPRKNDGSKQLLLF